jgi:hypothetical protein
LACNGYCKTSTLYWYSLCNGQLSVLGITTAKYHGRDITCFLEAPGVVLCHCQATSYDLAHQSATDQLFLFPVLQTMFPSPFYFFDEIDCALDTSAAMKVATYVSQHSKTAQYLLVSHRPQVFEAASCLIGVYTSPSGCGSAAVLAQFEEGEKDGHSTDGVMTLLQAQAAC